MDYFPDSVQKHGYIIKNPLPNNIPEYSNHKEKRIVAVSRLEPQKNLFMLLKAFQTVSKINSDYKLEIYGEGSERKAVEQTIQRLGLSNNVVLKGFQKKVNEKIVNAYMYVCTSDYEGLSNALLESMAMGLAVVSTDSAGGGAREVIKDGVNGVLVPVGDDEFLSKKMVWLIKNEEIAIRMGREALKIQ